ncbi:hypothetical protein H1R20_g901, partial [Candolleomyces eurysporus]
MFPTALSPTLVPSAPTLIDPSALSKPPAKFAFGLQRVKPGRLTIGIRKNFADINAQLISTLQSLGVAASTSSGASMLTNGGSAGSNGMQPTPGASSNAATLLPADPTNMTDSAATTSTPAATTTDALASTATGTPTIDIDPTLHAINAAQNTAALLALAGTGGTATSTIIQPAETENPATNPALPAAPTDPAAQGTGKYQPSQNTINTWYVANLVWDSF